MVEEFVNRNIHSLKEQINEWTRNNNDKEVVNVSYSAVMSSADIATHYALVFFKEKTTNLIGSQR